MPLGDYTFVSPLRTISKKIGRTVKKNELPRAGLHPLKAMQDDALQSALAALKSSDTKPSKQAK